MRREDYDVYENEDEIDLLDLVFVLLRRWKLILLVLVPVTVAGLIFASTRPNIYKAETTLIVSSGATSIGVDNSEITLNQKLVVTYSEVGKSRSILNNLISKYDLSTTPEILGSQISLSIVGDTELIKISYKNLDPKLAAVVLNEFSQEFMSKITEVMNVRNVKVIEPAEIPVKPMPKKSMIIVLASIILGGALGCMLAFIIEMLHKKLRKPEDISKILGAPMLGMVPLITEEEVKRDA